MVSSNLADWQKVTFEDAFTDITAKATKVDQSEFLHSGKYPIVDQGQNFIAGYTDDEELVWGDNLPVVIFGDHTRILKYVDFPFVLGADGTKVLKPNKDILPLFAYYQLLSFDIPSAGYSRHFKFLKDYKFQYPSMDEQKRIASLLRRADHLRQLRRTAHDLGDALLQSVFLEMFGHVRVNDKKWELARFEDVCETRLGKMLDDKKQTGKNKRPYLRNFNVRWHSLDLSDIAEMDFDEKDRKEFRLQYGDVLICEGGEVGRAAIWRNEMEECYFQKALHRARPNSKLANPEYIVHLLWWMAQSGGLVDSTSQVTFAHLTGEKLKELAIPVPPLSLQEEFAGVVARVESLRGRMGESTRQVEGLFESLLAESFG
ncbi:MAG: restriction endonuclease subunit S [Anaerolineales bacterium]|nr:MAG: restriction endonuclease subunit S [Anaerolineales bacterium]